MSYILKDVAMKKAAAMEELGRAMRARIKAMEEERKARIEVREIEEQEREYRFTLGLV